METILAGNTRKSVVWRGRGRFIGDLTSDGRAMRRQGGASSTSTARRPRRTGRSRGVEGVLLAGIVESVWLSARARVSVQSPADRPSSVRAACSRVSPRRRMASQPAGPLSRIRRMADFDVLCGGPCTSTEAGSTFRRPSFAGGQRRREEVRDRREPGRRDRGGDAVRIIARIIDFVELVGLAGLRRRSRAAPWPGRYVVASTRDLDTLRIDWRRTAAAAIPAGTIPGRSPEHVGSRRGPHGREA